MSEEIVRPPLDIVKVEVKVEEDDGSEGRDPGENHVDSDVDLLESTAELLRNGPWLSRGSDEGKMLVGRLLNLGERMEGWKKWKKQGPLKGEENRQLKQRLRESELRFDMMKRSKDELRRTHELEVDHRSKAEREVAKLKKVAEESVVSVLKEEVAVQTLATCQVDTVISGFQEAASSRPVFRAVAGMEVTSDESSSEQEDARHQNYGKASSSSEQGEDDGIIPDLTESYEATLSDLVAVLPSTSYHLRRRSHRGSTGKREKEKLILERSGHEINVGEATTKNTDATGKTKTRMESHLTVGQAKGKFSCRFCNRKFADKSNFRRHVETHNLDKIYKCKECGKRFKTSDYLSKHLKRHDPSRQKDFVCTTCSKSFYTSKDLAVHLVTHRSARPFKCSHCPHRFKLKSGLTMHLRAHSERRPFGCELCEKSFKRQEDLVAHFRMHTGERPYSCHVCKKGFTTTGNLKRHVRTHLGDEGKVHRCPFCEMKFIQSPDCQRHQRTCHKWEFEALAQLGPQSESSGPKRAD